jgi:hypothetical protein
MYTEDMMYIDNWRIVAAKLCLSTTGIWFDIMTSIPWSFMDLHSYLVSLPFPLSMHSRTEKRYEADMCVCGAYDHHSK